MVAGAVNRNVRLALPGVAARAVGGAGGAGLLAARVTDSAALSGPSAVLLLARTVHW